MKKWKVIFLIIVIIFILSLITSNLLKDFDIKSSGNKIAFIPIYGQITQTGSSSFFDVGGTSSNLVLDAIKKANEDISIKGIVLEINSPGGAVVASEEIASAVKNSKKPVVAWIREEGASGAYWVASAADKIVADPLSVTGSIGVLGSYLEFSGLFQIYGIGYERLVSGDYKDVGTPFRKLSDEEKSLLQSKVDKIHDYFVAEVAKNRNLSNSQIRGVSNGLFFLGLEAKDLGLVDELGGKEKAIDLLKELANVKEAQIVTFQKKKSLFDLFASLTSYNSFYIGKGISYGFYEKVKLDNDINFVA